MPTVLLFDIDGTLISTGGAGRRALDRAFARLFGRSDACDAIPFGGMTDRAIVRAGLEAIGQSAAEATIDAVIEDYLEHLEDEVTRADRYRVHPGVREVLEAVSGRPEIVVGLGTGNGERGARVKLARGDLNGWFRFGGFGSDHENRAELLRVGAQRGAALLDTPVARCRVVIIGDTPKDVQAALALGAECVGVATGSFSADVLLEAGATFVFPDLTAPGVLEAIVT